MTWLCKCGILNSGLNKQCVSTSSDHYQVSDNTPDFLMAYVAGRGLDLTIKGVKLSMTEQEELYAKFYNGSKILVKDMDITKLREFREELSQIALQAKATLAAADDELRERRAKSDKKDWLVTPIQSNQSTNDAINAVKIRTERMSKIDKMRKQLMSAGLDDETVNGMIRGMERRATDKNLRNLNTVTFERNVTEIAAIQLDAKKEVKMFDSSSLDFLKACKKCGQNPCRCDGLTPVLA
jgi:hypothetical protein